MLARPIATIAAAGAGLLLLAACGPGPVTPLEVLGVWHEVAPGDTVDSVAARYGADPVALAELNDLTRDGEIAGREEIFVPKAGGEPPGTGAPPPPPAAKTSALSGQATGGAVVGRCGVEGRPCFAWPADGEVATRFGPADGKHHDGLDILGATGSAVKAADAGRVIYAGNEIKGYGNLVLVRHEGDLITVYAHNDKNLVAEGDDVTRGQKIAEIGSTGSATAPHLHFEVRVSQRPRDPLLYLPTRE